MISKKLILLNAMFLLFFVITNCYQNPLTRGAANTESIPKGVLVTGRSQTAVSISWECNTATRGYLVIGPANGADAVIPSATKANLHSFTVPNLTPNTVYKYIPFCSENPPATLSLLRFTVSTLPNALPDTIQPIPETGFPNKIPLSPPPNIRLRGIWLVGGLTFANAPVAQIDLFDPVTETFYPNVTQIPTPRSHTSVIALQNKIYVIGGLQLNVSNVLVASRVAEVYDVFTDTWTTLSNIPNTLNSGMLTTQNNYLYLLGGTTTTDMTTGTILNTVYRLQPGLGATGTWAQYLSQSSIFARVDMPYCNISGNVYFAGGRRATDGVPQSTADVYLPSGNSTTTFVEPSLNTARHGAAAACYRPSATDPFPSDPQAMLVVGGANDTNIFQPDNSITPNGAYDYYRVDIPGFTFAVGPSLPTALYYPAMEISYDNRNAYVFGGATTTNTPTTLVYSIGLQNPTAGPWRLVPVPLPIARYAHSAVIINR